MVNLEKQIIIGKKGLTVVYSMANFRFDTSDNKLKWDQFRFYTPEGDSTETVDSIEYKFFTVSAEEYLLERHASLNKILMISTAVGSPTKAIEIEDGAAGEQIVLGLEGDIIISGHIPTDPTVDIEIKYKEVTDGDS